MRDEYSEVERNLREAGWSTFFTDLPADRAKTVPIEGGRLYKIPCVFYCRKINDDGCWSLQEADVPKVPVITDDKVGIFWTAVGGHTTQADLMEAETPGSVTGFIECHPQYHPVAIAVGQVTSKVVINGDRHAKDAYQTVEAAINQPNQFRLDSQTSITSQSYIRPVDVPMHNLDGRRFNPTSQSGGILKQVAVGGSVPGSVRQAELEVFEKTDVNRMQKVLSYPQQPARWPRRRDGPPSGLQTVRVLPNETSVDMGSVRDNNAIRVPVTNTADVVDYIKVSITDTTTGLEGSEEMMVPQISQVNQSALS